MSSGRVNTSAPKLTHSDDKIERTTAHYLFAISDLSDSGTDRITTGELRSYLNVAPSSVTEMISKLDEKGLVHYEKYHGVTLTEEGEAVATEAGWRFCVVSTFFDSELGMELDAETAFEIGFVLPENGVFSLQDLIDSGCMGLCPQTSGTPETCLG